jgi:formylglycine-generating enzyme required for sulfatase activity
MMARIKLIIVLMLATVAITACGATKVQVRVRPADGMEMVYVPAGTFRMGSTDAQIEEAVAACLAAGLADSACREFPNESLQHQVYLDAYWIDRIEVTNAQYCTCVEAGACSYLDSLEDPAYNPLNLPVVQVPLGRGQRLLPVGRRPAADRGRVGKGGARDRWAHVSLGEQV